MTKRGIFTEVVSSASMRQRLASLGRKFLVRREQKFPVQKKSLIWIAVDSELNLFHSQARRQRTLPPPMRHANSGTTLRWHASLFLPSFSRVTFHDDGRIRRRTHRGGMGTRSLARPLDGGSEISSWLFATAKTKNKADCLATG